MTKIGKIYIHIILKYANCVKNYQTIAFKYPTKLRAQMEVWKKKIEKFQVNDKLSVIDNSVDEKLVLE